MTSAPASTTAKGWVLTSRPTEGPLTSEYFDFAEYELPALNDGDFLLDIDVVSLDPTHRIWATDAPQYMDPQPLGRPMRAGAVGTVAESRNEKFPAGSRVSAFGAWASRVVVTKEGAAAAAVLPPGTSAEMSLGLFGAPGLTAYHGYCILGCPTDESDKTFVVDAAAGSVGSLILQIMKHQAKCKCIAISGSDDKVAWTKELGADYAINYKTENVEEKLREYAPDGVDYVFENVGGDMLASILTQMNNFGKIAVCGLISQYTNASEGGILQNHFEMVLHRRLTIQGLICSDFFAQFPDKAQSWVGDLIAWNAADQLEFKVDKQKGLENILDHYDRLFAGKNMGKLMVEINDDSPSA